VTVAAVILAATPASALAEADGQVAIRRIADVAWAGGAVPLVVVAADPDGSVARALTGAPVTLAEPAPAEGGPVGQVLRGLDVARSAVTETQAALVWPAAMTWVGAETVTSLIEAHGTDRHAILRPAWEDEAGWPALVPLALAMTLRDLAPDRMPGEALDDLVSRGVPVRLLDLGDPGTVLDRATARTDLPPYTGPAGPPAGHVHEWGSVIAEQPDDTPLTGPALAPYGQAVAEDPDQPG
jgi:CTP:molybdopterin cytidylyltransferase MocA